mgnify:CR=1 FL=1
MKNQRILVISSANIDFVQRMRRIPYAGETVVQNDIEAATSGNDQLTELTVGMPPAGGSARDIVQVINALDIKGNELSPLDHAQGTPLVVGNGDIYQTGLF